MIRSFTNILFPLITYPYIARILSVEDLGRINFGQSIISYFLLFAGLGITTFATRNGSQIRESKDELSEFANRMFSINLFSMIVSYCGLLILLMLPTKIADYRSIILLQGVAVILSPFAVDWLYNIEEDFGYITKRSIFVQVVSLVLMLALVKSSDDMYLYIAIMTLSSCFANAFNFFHSRKYVRIRVVKDTKWSEYKKPILTFFVNSIASSIYLSSDMTLLGMLSSDYTTGLYGTATKIYSIFKQMFNAVVGTMLPRMAYLRKNDENEYEKLICKALNTVFVFVLPAMLGIIILRQEILLIISNENYLPAAKSLVILAIALFFATLANLLVSGILICSGREKKVAFATTVSAMENVLLNVIAIPLWNQDGAAFTTLLAEITVCIIAVVNARDVLKNIFDATELLKCIFSSIVMATCLIVVQKIVVNLNLWIRVGVISILGGTIYFLLMLVMRSKTTKEMVNYLRDKIVLLMQRKEI